MNIRNDGGSYDRVPVEEEQSQVSVSSENKTSLDPLELDDGTVDDLDGQDGSVRDVPILRLTDLWLASVVVTLFFLVPALVTFIVVVRDLIGRIWPTVFFAFHLTIALAMAIVLVPSTTIASRPSVVQRLLSSVVDICLFGWIYPVVCDVFVGSFFTDIDGTPVIDYEDYRRRFQHLRMLGIAIAMLRCVIEAVSIFFLWLNRRYRDVNDDFQLPRMLATALAWSEQADSYFSFKSKSRFVIWLRRMLWLFLLVSLILLGWTLVSVTVHCISWPTPKQELPQCDPLDTTECCLPFPSFHHMVRDSSTETGWRVALQGDTLPPLKGGIRLDPSFLNQLDGFSTMAPMLFYLEGLKEAHEKGKSEVRLQGPNDIELSVTNRSITLLVDVKSKTLVPHSAEIDYLDNTRPLVMVFPAKPLRHNTHYALAVVGATGPDGYPLSPTPGMQAILSGTNDAHFSERRERYEGKVIPALASAAPWFSYEPSPESLQLLFDFKTISAESQLGPIRAVRDSTLSFIDYIGGLKWGDWSEHVHTIRIDEGVCSRSGTLVARTIHAEIDVPWFLRSFGPGHRESTLDHHAAATGQPVTIGKAKFVVHVPCSLRAAAIRGANAKELRAVMEYGHGLFYNRDEAADRYILEMANANGYIITAMDWRGMSSFDLLMVVKVLMSTPRTFEAVRDNLIQGFACKLALQHFARHGLLKFSDWVQFKTGSNQNHPIPLYRGQQPAFVFYGISQGGILGAGYSALSGPTRLIDRAVLGVPGTPFALILTRSLDFNSYDAILLLNFYNNRHVRILLSIVQMAWDPVEGSGMLAPPLIEPFPPVLLQAGLGDVEVPTIACEALARGFGACTLPNSPRDIWDTPVAPSTDIVLESSDKSPVVLTELMYQEEYAELPSGDRTRHTNDVHFCVRRDPHLVRQLTEFINEGEIIDPCEEDGCIRAHVECGVAN